MRIPTRAITRRWASAGALAMLLVLLAAPVHAASPITMSARGLLGGRFEAGEWAAVAVSLANDGPPVSGRLVADSASGQVARAVELPAGARKEVVLYLRPAAFVRQLEVAFESDAGRLTATVELRALDTSGATVAIVGDTAGALRAQLAARDVGRSARAVRRAGRRPAGAARAAARGRGHRLGRRQQRPHRRAAPDARALGGDGRPAPRRRRSGLAGSCRRLHQLAPPAGHHRRRRRPGLRPHRAGGRAAGRRHDADGGDGHPGRGRPDARATRHGGRSPAHRERRARRRTGHLDRGRPGGAGIRGLAARRCRLGRALSPATRSARSSAGSRVRRTWRSG